jgi:hypothetical protein
MAGTLKARGTLPHWHWHPEDLQQSCLSADFSKGAFGCCELCVDPWCIEEDAAGIGEDALCIAQASLPVLALLSWAALLWCAGTGGAEIVDAYATPTCIPSASWNARRVNRRRARDRTRTQAAYSIHKKLSKSGPRVSTARSTSSVNTRGRPHSEAKGRSGPKAQYEPVRRPEERPPLLVLPFAEPGRP